MAGWRRSAPGELGARLPDLNDPYATRYDTPHPQWPFYEPPPQLPNSQRIRSPRWLVKPRVNRFLTTPPPIPAKRLSRSQSLPPQSRRDGGSVAPQSRVVVLLRKSPRSPALKPRRSPPTSPVLDGNKPARSSLLLQQEQEARAAAEAERRKIEDDEAPRLAGKPLLELNCVTLIIYTLPI